MQMLPLLLRAADMALPTTDHDLRKYWLGSVGIRDDGTLVSSKNGEMNISTTVKNFQVYANSHAEGRLLRKLGMHGEVYVARVSKKDKSLAMARPCPMCQTRLRAAKVSKVYYTINNNQYGIWYPDSDTDRVYTV
jgi:tRNA(Arg) A34 adenosine deaminase TadA